MDKEQKRVLKALSKDQLIYLIEQYYNGMFMISEVCVEESKCHIKSDDAVDEIRNSIYILPGFYNEGNLKAYIDVCMGKITSEEYRKIILG